MAAAPFRHSQRTLSLLREGRPCPRFPFPYSPRPPGPPDLNILVAKLVYQYRDGVQRVVAVGGRHLGSVPCLSDCGRRRAETGAGRGRAGKRTKDERGGTRATLQGLPHGHWPLYAGQARISLVRTNEAPPTAHLQLVEGIEVRLPPYSREGKETEVRGILATKIVPAYVAANNERDEQRFLANKWRDSKDAKPALWRVPHKVSAHASLGLHDVMWGPGRRAGFGS